MNAPKFDISRLPTQVGQSYMEAVIAEENRVCGAIDERIAALENEFHAMVERVNALKLQLDATVGLISRWRVRRQMKGVVRRLDDNRSMRHELSIARWRRTYGS